MGKANGLTAEEAGQLGNSIDAFLREHDMARTKSTWNPAGASNVALRKKLIEVEEALLRSSPYRGAWDDAKLNTADSSIP